MGDVVFVEQRIIRDLVKVERSAVHSFVFAGEVVYLLRVDTSHSANLRLSLHHADSRKTEEVFSIGAHFHKTQFKEIHACRLGVFKSVLKHSKIRARAVAYRRRECHCRHATVTQTCHTHCALRSTYYV